MKSQAETAGRLFCNNTRPQKGTVLRDVELVLADGSHALVSGIRGRTNLIMVIGLCPETLLQDLGDNAPALKEQNTRVLVITTTAGEAPPKIKVIAADLFISASAASSEVLRTLGAADAAGNPVSTIYVTDRFGEVFAVFQRSGAELLPSADEIIRWLEFINFQCEECSPPEWPE